jgi:hypothetical protein
LVDENLQVSQTWIDGRTSDEDAGG